MKRTTGWIRAACHQVAHTLAMMSVAAWSLLPSGMALAGPEGGEVAEGNVNITAKNDVDTVIRQYTDNAIINWQSFDIGVDESVRFYQPDETSRILNRVMDGRMTQIDGRLQANGQVYIANPNGIFFGGQAVVNTAQLIAAAGNISNADFMAGIDRFTGLAGDVVNQGMIGDKETEAVYLIGQHVKNYGSITATDGLVMMLAGDEVYLSDAHSPLLIKVTPSDGEPGVLNAGTVDVRKGRVLFGAADAYTLAVRNEGEVRGKEIEIVAPGSRVQVAGLLDASDEAWAHDRDRGGSIHVLADEVVVADGAVLNASGADGGGEIRIGGDVQGSDERDLHVALYTYVGNADLRVDSTRKGNAGSIVVWAKDSAWFYGNASARGGYKEGSNGGFIEVSGLMGLEERGTYDLSAANGNAGLLLFDPVDIFIVGSASDPSGEGSGSGGGGSSVSAMASTSLASLPSLNGFRISESSVESGEFGGGSAQVMLDARRSISVEGQFTDTDGDNIADVTFSGQGLLLTTHNSSQDGAGVIDLAGTNGQPLQVRLTNGAQLAVVASSTGEATGDIRLGHVTSDGGMLQVATGRGSVRTLGDIDVGNSIADIQATDNLDVGGNVTAKFVKLHAGSDASGELNLGDVEVQGDSITLWAGEGGGSGGGSANIGNIDQATFASQDGTAAPALFRYRQDADVADTNLPTQSQFGNHSVENMYYMIESTRGSVALHDTTQIMNTNLSVWGDTGVRIGNSLQVTSLSLGATTGVIAIGRDAGAATITVTDDAEDFGEIFALVIDVQGDATFTGPAVLLFEDTWIRGERVIFGTENLDGGEDGGAYVTSGVHPAFADYAETDTETGLNENLPVLPALRPTNPDPNDDFVPYLGPYHLDIWARGGIRPADANSNPDLVFTIPDPDPTAEPGDTILVEAFGGEVLFTGGLGNLYDLDGGRVADPYEFYAPIFEPPDGAPTMRIPLPLVFGGTNPDTGNQLFTGDPSWSAYLAARAIQESRAGLLTLKVRSSAAENPLTGEIAAFVDDRGTANDPTDDVPIGAGLIVFEYRGGLVNTQAMTVIDPGLPTDPAPPEPQDIGINVNMGGPFLFGNTDELAAPGIRTVGSQVFGDAADDPIFDNLMVVRDEVRFIPQGSQLKGIATLADLEVPFTVFNSPLSVIPGPQPDPDGAGPQLGDTWGGGLLVYGQTIGERPPSPNDPFPDRLTGRLGINFSALTYILNFDNGTEGTPDYIGGVPGTSTVPAADITGNWLLDDFDIDPYTAIFGLNAGQRDQLIGVVLQMVRQAFEEIPTEGQDARSPFDDGTIPLIGFTDVDGWLGRYDLDDSIPEHYFINIGSVLAESPMQLTGANATLLNAVAAIGAVRNQHLTGPAATIDNPGIGPNFYWEPLPDGGFVQRPVPPGSIIGVVFSEQANLLTVPADMFGPQDGLVAAARFLSNLVINTVGQSLGAWPTEPSTDGTPRGLPDVMAAGSGSLNDLLERNEFAFTGVGASPATPIFASTEGLEINNVDIILASLGEQIYPDNLARASQMGIFAVDVADVTVQAPGDVSFLGSVRILQFNVDNRDSATADPGADDRTPNTPPQVVSDNDGRLTLGGDILLRSINGFIEGADDEFLEFRLNADVTEVVTFRFSATELLIGMEVLLQAFDLITGVDIGIDFVSGDPLAPMIVEAQDVTINALDDFDIDGSGQLVLTNRDMDGVPFADRPQGFSLTIKAEFMTTFDQAASFSNDGLAGTLVLLPRSLYLPPFGAPLQTEDADIGIGNAGFDFNIDPDFFTGITGTTAANPFVFIIGTPLDPVTETQSTGDITIGTNGGAPIVGGDGVVDLTLYGGDLTFLNTLTLADGSTADFNLTGGITSFGNDLVLGTGGILDLTAAGNVSIATELSQVRIVNTSLGFTSISNTGALELLSVSVAGDFDAGAGGGDLTAGGPVVIGGDAFFSASGAGGDVILNQLLPGGAPMLSVAGTIALGTSDGDAFITNAQPIIFDSSLFLWTVNGDLTAISTGPITDIGDNGMAVTGIASFTATGPDNDIAFDGPGNNLNQVLFNGRNVVISDLSPFDVDGLTFVAGSMVDTLTATANNDLTINPGAFDTTGLVTLTSNFGEIEFGAGAGTTIAALLATAPTITFGDNSVGVTGLAILSATDINFGTGLTFGSLDATAVNDIFLQPGSMIVADDATLRSTAGVIDTLDDADGDAELTAGGDVTLQGSNIGTTNPIEVAGIGGNQSLTLINTGGAGDDITVNVLGVTFTALNITEADTFSNATVNFTATGDVINIVGGATASLDGIDLSSSNLSLGFELTQLNGVIDLGLLNMAGNSLTVTSNDGNITNSDTVLSTGIVNLDSGTADIALDNAGNDFNTVNASGDALTLTDINSVTLNTTVNQIGVNLTGVGATGIVNELDGVTIVGSTIAGNTLNFTAGGDILVADAGIGGGAGSTVVLTSMTNIEGTDLGGADIVAADLTLNANNVGLVDALEVTVADSFSANVVDVLNVESIGDLPIGMIEAENSSVTITAGFTDTVSALNPADFFPDILSSQVTITAGHIGPLELFTTESFDGDNTNPGGLGAGLVTFIDGRPADLTFTNGSSDLVVVTNPFEDLPGEPELAGNLTSRFYVIHPDGEGPDIDWLSELETEDGAGPTTPRARQFGDQGFRPRTLGRLLVVTGRSTVDFGIIHQTVFHRYLAARHHPSLLGEISFSADDYIAWLRQTATIGRPNNALDAAIVLDGLRELARNLDLLGLYDPGYEQARLDSLTPHAPVGMSAADLDAVIRVLTMLDEQTVAVAN